MRSLILGLAVTVSATSVFGAEVQFGSDWKEQRFSLFSSNDYGFQGTSLTVVSEGSVSLAYAPLDETLWGARGAKWSWNVQEGVPATDLRNKGGDDRNLALYAIFLPADDAERLKGKSIRRLLKSESVRVLTYVWGGSHKRGAFLDSPYLGTRGKTIILRPSGNGKFSEQVDLATDYKRAFGDELETIVGFAVSADSDDTDTVIRASISDLSVN
ncbi:MAG: DUF3047 domain-containing protein [Litoreibacter sp.]